MLYYEYRSGEQVVDKMNKDQIMEALAKQKKVLESQGYTVAYIAVYGSQNYNLDIYTDDYQSDVDMKAIVVPTLDDLVRNSKPVSITVDTEWGQCDVKDIRTYFEVLLKANPAYIETLFTDYYIIDEDFQDEMREVLDSAEDLVYALRGQFARAIYGMMCEKEKALCHPYPSIAWKIEKFGYDGKQLSHIYRLLVLMEDYFISGIKLKDCIKSRESAREFIIDLKLNVLSLEDAKEFAEIYINSGEMTKSILLKEIEKETIDYSIKDKLLTLSQEIIKRKIINEIKERV
jgi:hypothetical protein